MGKQSRGKWGPALMPTLRDQMRDGYLRRAAASKGYVVAPPAGSPPQAYANAQRSTEAARHIAAEMRRQAEELEDSGLYWVSDEMAQMTLEASHKMPRVNPVSLPDDRGFLGFQKPLPPAPVVNEQHPPKNADGTPVTIPVDGLIWAKRPDRRVIDVSVMYRAERAKTLPALWELEGPMAQLLPNWGTIPMDEAMIVSLPLDGLDLSDPSRHQFGPDSLPLVAFIGALWHLMFSDDVAERTQMTPPSGKARGGAPRGKDTGAGGRSSVTLVDMRPLRQEVTRADTQGRSYSYRFVVSGHWRNQAYGPARELRREQWIAPYIKGPKNAPMQSRERVNVWRHM